MEKSTVAYRIGRLLIQLSEKRWTRFAFSAGIGFGGGVILLAVHNALLASPTSLTFLKWADACTVAGFLFLLTYVELTVVRERRIRVMRDVTTVAELNHHVRNALQAIQYAAYTSSDRTQVETIQSSVVRIDNILRELFPILGEASRAK
jgi:hypothetical protein